MTLFLTTLNEDETLALGERLGVLLRGGAAGGSGGGTSGPAGGGTDGRTGGGPGCLTGDVTSGRSGGAVILLDGDLGAGKTRLAKGVAQGLGVSKTVTSPSFNLVLEYPIPQATQEDSKLCDNTLSFAGLTGEPRLDRGTYKVSDFLEESDTLYVPLSSPAHTCRPERSEAQPKDPEDTLDVENDPVNAITSFKILRHFDLYRLERAEQLDDLDYFGLIEEPDAVSLVEWGNKFASHLPLDHLLVSMMVDEDDPNKRLIKISAEGARSQGLLESLA